MEFTPGFAVDFATVEDICFALQARMSDIIHHFSPCLYHDALAQSLKSEMNVYLAYLGQLRLDGWAPLPAAETFTLRLKDALERADGSLLSELSNSPFPQHMPDRSVSLLEAAFPCWWTALPKDVAEIPADWRAFDLGGHICEYGANLLHDEIQHHSSVQEINAESGNPGTQNVRTASEFTSNLHHIREELATVIRGVEDIMIEMGNIWDADVTHLRGTERDLVDAR